MSTRPPVELPDEAARTCMEKLGLLLAVGPKGPARILG